MGQYLSFAKQCLKEIKPKVEERTGVKLEDLVVRDPSGIPEFSSEKDSLMFITPYFLYDDVVFVNEKNCIKEQLPAPLGITHELAHKVHEELIGRELDKTEDSKFPKFFLNMWKYRRYNKMISFKEGFAEYMALDHLSDIHDDAQTLQEITEERRNFGSYLSFGPRISPNEKGYKFFKKVLFAIGQDKVIDVASSPPMGEIEVNMPLLYVLRKYPLKGIWNIPKFFARSLTTKIVKEAFGYADFDFPNKAKKGSDKGKVSKASPYYKFKEILPSCRFLIENLEFGPNKPSIRSQIYKKILRARKVRKNWREN